VRRHVVKFGPGAATLADIEKATKIGVPLSKAAIDSQVRFGSANLLPPIWRLARVLFAQAEPDPIIRS
jgi:hypothetical protein